MPSIVQSSIPQTLSLNRSGKDLVTPLDSVLISQVLCFLAFVRVFKCSLKVTAATPAQQAADIHSDSRNQEAALSLSLTQAVVCTELITGQSRLAFTSENLRRVLVGVSVLKIWRNQSIHFTFVANLSLIMFA